MTDKEFEEHLKHATLCGYSFEELLIFADACRKAGITEDKLHDFCMNVSSAFEYISNKIIEESIKMIDEHFIN